MARRWPVGLHTPAGSQLAIGASPMRRPPATDQRDYWRHTVTELHAGASVVWATPPGQAPPPFNPAMPVSAGTGPQGVGERWLLAKVQVHTGAQYGQPPLVVQQIAGQAAGTTVVPPPPVVAQIWRAVAGQNTHLLGQTTSGGNDDVAVSQELSAGETVVVVWYGLATGMSAWFRLLGTKHTLSAQ